MITKTMIMMMKWEVDMRGSSQDYGAASANREESTPRKAEKKANALTRRPPPAAETTRMTTLTARVLLIGVVLLVQPEGTRGFRSFQLLSSSGRGSSHDDLNLESRRAWLSKIVATTSLAPLLFLPTAAKARDFAPGGTLVDYTVGVTVGNPEASPSRKPDNSNVFFDRDYYFKFGTAAPWIEPGSTDFPKTVPFVRVQQRYDALKKYKERVLQGVANIQALESASPKDIADPTAADVYYLRPMGLLANSFLASENTGSTNELFLARWYINEILLLIGDMRRAGEDEAARQKSYKALKKAVNSYIGLINRVITSKLACQKIIIGVRCTDAEVPAIKGRILGALHRNFSLRELLRCFSYSRQDHARRQVDMFNAADEERLALLFHRNGRLAEFAKNPYSVDRRLWPKYFDMTRQAGYNQISLGLLMLGDFPQDPPEKDNQRFKLFSRTMRPILRSAVGCVFTFAAHLMSESATTQCK